MSLSPWRRLWLMFAGVFLASTFAVTAAVWPKRDPAVVADLQSPACQAWLGNAAARPPEGQCAALRGFLDHERITLTSEDEYDGYRVSKGIKWALIFLAVWAAFVGSFYVLGWAGVKASRLLPQRRKGPAS